jgi:hypothetical protein
MAEWICGKCYSVGPFGDHAECGECRSADVVPVTSPRGAQLATASGQGGGAAQGGTRQATATPRPAPRLEPEILPPPPAPPTIAGLDLYNLIGAGVAVVLVLVIVLGCWWAFGDSIAEEDRSTVIGTIVFGLLVFVGFVVAYLHAAKKRRERLDSMRLEAGPVPGGVYLTGHPSLTNVQAVEVGLTRTDFVILSEGGRLLGNIPRGALVSVEVLDKTTVQTNQRFTATRIALLGVFALAVPKTSTTVSEVYLLSVEWMAGGLRCTTFLRFGDIGRANRALAFLAQYKLDA